MATAPVFLNCSVHNASTIAEQVYWILFIQHGANETTQVYIPHAGHKHFTRNGNPATLFDAVKTCPEFLAAVANGEHKQNGWDRAFLRNGVTFHAQKSNQAGDCIKIWHSHSAMVYAAESKQIMAKRYSDGGGGGGSHYLQTMRNRRS